MTILEQLAEVLPESWERSLERHDRLTLKVDDIEAVIDLTWPEPLNGTAIILLLQDLEERGWEVTLEGRHKAPASARYLCYGFRDLRKRVWCHGATRTEATIRVYLAAMKSDPITSEVSE